MSWIKRDTIDIDLKNLSLSKSGEIETPDISTIRILIPGLKYPVDVGAWCYSERKRDNAHMIAFGQIDWLVEDSSFRKGRVTLVKKYIELLYSEVKLGKTAFTIKSRNTVFQYYINWCDNYKPEYLDKKQNYRAGLVAYTDNLINKTRTNELNINTAANYQAIALSFIDYISNDNTRIISSGIPRIKKNSKRNNATLPPSDQKAKSALSLYTCIFEGIYSFLINNEKYPWKLDLPNESVWVFPGTRIIATKKMLSYRESWKHKRYVYDYSNGQINSIEYIMKNFRKSNPLSEGQARSAIKRSKELIASSNNNRYHIQKLSLATLAQQSFTMMFFAHTNINLSSISSIEWNEQTKTSDLIQGFKTIKPRSNNMEVDCHLSNNFYKQFKKYLKIRKYLIDAYKIKHANLLFFRIHQGKALKLPMAFSGYYHSRIKTIFDYNICISSREWRAYKSDWLIRNTNIPTTALLLQNSTKTVTKHYIEGSASQADNELSLFYKKFYTKGIINDQSSTTRITVGSCKKPNSPDSNSNNINTEANCKSPEGCLFCNQYTIIADAIDIRKLLSIKYVITETRSLSHSDTHYNELFSDVLNRITSILEALRNKNTKIKSLVNSIEREVTIDEKLSPYWDMKLKLLVDIGLI